MGPRTRLGKNKREKSTREWKNEVQTAAESQHVEKLKEECLTKSRGETKQKTKTKYAEKLISDPNYKRKPDTFLGKHQSILHARALIMG